MVLDSLALYVVAELAATGLIAWKGVLKGLPMPVRAHVNPLLDPTHSDGCDTSRPASVQAQLFWCQDLPR
jgi:hypothetical protein